jgi:alanyl-tRNA synthetase
MSAVTPDLTGKVQAGNLVREVAQVVGGRGGGKPDMGRGGGTEPGKLAEAFQLARQLAAEKLGG